MVRLRDDGAGFRKNAKPPKLRMRKAGGNESHVLKRCFMIELKNISKTFEGNKKSTHALKNVNLTINDGEIFGIIGFSGAGKSTLVRCINLLERPSAGEVIVNGQNLCSLKTRELNEARKKIGMIFQQFNLLEQRTVAKNVRYPLEIAGVDKKEANAKVQELLEIVELADKAESYPSQLSGGQKQRVAIARALATNPNIILCDEATSALDPITTKTVLELLARLNRELGVCIVVITHEMSVVQQICNRVAVIDAGEICEIGSVQDVFLNPQSETTKKLIDPTRNINLANEFPGALRLAFNGETTSEPVVAGLVRNCDCDVNILSANVSEIGGHYFGQMILEVPQDEQTRAKVTNYLDSRGIVYSQGGKN